MMSITEQAGKAAQSTIDALKSTPAILSLLLINLLFMGVLVYVSIKSSARWDREIERWVELAQACQKP
jgi:hypothetical protein